MWNIWRLKTFMLGWDLCVLQIDCFCSLQTSALWHYCTVLWCLKHNSTPIFCEGFVLRHNWRSWHDDAGKVEQLNEKLKVFCVMLALVVERWWIWRVDTRLVLRSWNLPHHKWQWCGVNSLRCSHSWLMPVNRSTRSWLSLRKTPQKSPKLKKYIIVITHV